MTRNAAVVHPSRTPASHGTRVSSSKGRGPQGGLSADGAYRWQVHTAGHQNQIHRATASSPTQELHGCVGCGDMVVGVPALDVADRLRPSASEFRFAQPARRGR